MPILRVSLYNLSVSLALASSPGRKDSLRPEGDVANSDRGRTTFGRPGKPCCPNRQQLRHYALTRCIWQAAVNQNSGAQLFPIAENFVRPVQPPPTRQWLPYQGSWREAPERLYEEQLLRQSLRDAAASKGRAVGETQRLYHRPRFHSASRLPEGDPLYNLSVTFGDTSPGRRGLGIAQTPSFPPPGELAAQQTEKAIPKNGRTSSRKCLRVSFFEENAAVPTHVGAPSFQ